jgi:hypothetical protein
VRCVREEFKKYTMKKIFFAILAVTLLSSSFAFAGNAKHGKKKAKKTECVWPKIARKTAHALRDAVIKKIVCLKKATLAHHFCGGLKLLKPREY